MMRGLLLVGLTAAALVVTVALILLSNFLGWLFGGPR